MAERDLHVSALTYRLETSDGLLFENPPPLELETDAFIARLEGGTLTLTMRDHYATCEDAKNGVASFLRNWELAEALKRARREMWFMYEGCDVVDRADPRATILAAALGQLTLTGHAVTLTLTLRHYPPPPTDFNATPEVELLWTLFEDYQAGRVRLTDLGYFCLTVLEATFGGARGKHVRPEVSARLHVDLEIFNTLGDLVSEKGDERTARKMPKGGWQPHSSRELTWIADVVRALIRRAGENPGMVERLTMADFPRLGD